MRLLFIVVLMAFPLASLAQDPWLNDLSTKWQNARKYSLKVAELMPESDFGFKPVADEMTFGAQLIHSAGNMIWLSSTHLTAQKPPFIVGDLEKLKPAEMSKRELITILAKSFDYALDAIQHIDPKTLDEQVKFFAGPMSRRKIVLLMHDHLTHHRGQLVVYLRLSGVKPPQYVGW